MEEIEKYLWASWRPDAFDKLVEPEKSLLFSPEEVAENRKAWIDEWTAAMSR